MIFKRKTKKDLMTEEHIRIARQLAVLFKETYAEALMHQIGLRQEAIDKALFRKGKR